MATGECLRVTEIGELADYSGYYQNPYGAANPVPPPFEFGADEPIHNVDTSQIIQRQPNYIGRNLNGSCVPAYKEWFYNQIWVIPDRVDASQILSTDINTIEVWNAYIDSSKTLSAINGPTVEETGVELIPQSGNPGLTTYNPLQSHYFDLVINFEGPPEANALYEFIFDNESPTLTVTGFRLIIWGYMPQNKWNEAYKWKTDVLKAHNGKEQFVKVRPEPRREFTYRYFGTNTVQRGRLFNKLNTSMAFDFGIPIWQQLRHPTSDVVGNVIPVDTTNSEYEVGSGVFLWKSNTVFEAGVIESITDTAITITNNLGNSYTVDDYVTPLLISKMPKTVSSNLYPVNATDLSITFRAIKSKSITPDDLPSQYNGLDVLSAEPFMSGTTQPWSHSGNWENIDFETGVFDSDYAVQFAKTHRAYVKRFFGDLDEIWSFKQWLYKMAGKQGKFYLPDYAEKLDIVGNVSAVQTVLDLTFTELYKSYENTPFVTDVQMEFLDGEIQRRSIVLVEKFFDGSDTYDRMTVSSNFGRAFNMSDVKHFSLLHQVRIDSDTINFEWEHNGLCLVKFNTVEVTDVV